MKCRICDSTNLNKFLSLGKSPLANNFLSKEQLEQEEKSFPLETAFCDRCKLVQLTYVVPPEIMFKHYVYVSSTSNTFKKHFSDMAKDISKEFNLTEQSLVVDIGSNDGILLKGFKNAGIRIIGVEPATNVAKIAQESGIETINSFFNENTAKEIIERKGHADIITAANVFAHADDINDFIKNVKLLLKKNGIFVIEIQYLVDTIEKMTFDNIYHEHLSYYSLTSLVYFLKKHGMWVSNVQRVDSHGGSLRVFIKKAEGRFKINGSIKKILEYEKNIGIDNARLYKKFVFSSNKKLRANIMKWRIRLCF